MERSKLNESLEQVEPQKETTKRYGQNTVEQLYKEALQGESFEDASFALEGVEALQDFREKTSKLGFGSFSWIVDEMTNLNRLPLSAEEKGKRAESLVETLSERAGRFSPRVADLYQGMISEIQGKKHEPYFEINQKKIEELKKSGDLDILFSGNISWEIKLNRIETRLTDYLAGARALDKREGKEMSDDIREWRKQELKKAPTRPPERRSESQPGVDPLERLEGDEKVPAIWSIEPAWGGYYKEQSFSKWDSGKNVWFEDKYEYGDIEYAPLSGNTDPKKGPIDTIITASAFAGKWISLPIPYTHNLHKIEAGGRNCYAKKDQNGDVVILAEGGADEEIEINVFLAASPDKKFTAKPENITAPDMPSEFSEETNNELSEIAGKKRGNIAKARAIKSYVVRRIQYLSPKDPVEAEHYNNIYRTSPKGFAGAVDEVKKGDCDVVNTYFAALCAKSDIPVRHCVGHSVKGKDKEGRAGINSGTGHGWSEIFDEVKKEWVRFDATPPGDPNLEDDESKKGEEPAPGDYGGYEAVGPTDEQLEELRKKLADKKEELSYTKEERQLAQAAGVELKEARQIVKEINEAERIKLPNGELVIDALAKLFNAIVESRKTSAMSYEGPVRKREGGESIEEIVGHKIGILAGEADPLSREKPAEEIKEEKSLGGFDLYIIGDKSGSMQNEVEGEQLWQMQRRAEYLIFSSLYRFERNLERAGLKKENQLSVRTQGISFRGNGPDDIDLDKDLSSNFTARDKVKMWRSLTEQGGGNGDPEALNFIYEQIKNEIEETEKRGGKDNRLRIIIACSDGGYIGNDANKMRALAEGLYRLNVIVAGIGLTETASAVPVAMNNPPYSRGDIVADINDLPAVVAKHVVLEAVKLFPEKAQESAKQIIESSIKKFEI